MGAAADASRLDLTAMAAATRNTGYPVVGLVKQLSALAGPDAGRWTHWGATTQDIMDTAVVLQLRDGLALIEADLRATVAGFAALAATHRDTVMAGRTHLQHALPIRRTDQIDLGAKPLHQPEIAGQKRGLGRGEPPPEGERIFGNRVGVGRGRM